MTADGEAFRIDSEVLRAEDQEEVRSDTLVIWKL